jgi:hypothetical protein
MVEQAFQTKKTQAARHRIEREIQQELDRIAPRKALY